MDKVPLDDEPAVNFQTATLEIAKDPDSIDGSTTAKLDTEDSSKTTEQVPSIKDISYAPFKNVDVHSFFTDRKEVVERAINDCQEFLKDVSSNDIVGSWLLTEISLWDTEKERLVLLTSTYIYSVKYDFISLKILEYSKIPLANLDTIVIGELIYPTSSLAPRLNGLAEVMSYVINCAVRQEWSSLTTCSNLTQFEPRKFFLCCGEGLHKKEALENTSIIYEIHETVLPNKINNQTAHGNILEIFNFSLYTWRNFQNAHT